MGKRPDGEIAKAAGLDRRYVVVYRYYAGIPAYQRTSNKGGAEGESKGKRRTSFRRSRLDEYRHLMGEVPDGRIADLAGCSREAVMRYRSRHNISPATRGSRAQVEPPAIASSAVVESPAAQAPSRQPVAPTPVVDDLPPDDLPPDDLPPEVDDILASEPGLANVVVLERSEAKAESMGVAPSHGYLVTAQIAGDRHTYLVIGSDIARAARRAMRMLTRLSPDASILELSYHAEMLL